MCVGAFLHQKTSVFVVFLLVVFLIATEVFAGSAPIQDILPGFQEDEDHAAQAEIQADIVEIPITFIANAGQADANVRFMVKGSQHTIFFTPQEIVFAVSGKMEGENAHSSVVRLRFTGASREVKVQGGQTLSGIANFFLGNDPENWRTNVATYATITYHDLYPGIDLIYSGKQGRLRSEFVVSPGTDPTVILMEYSGTSDIYLREDGALVLETPIGEIVEAPPLIYQVIDAQRIPVEGGYRLLGGGKVAFSLGEYITTEPLIIDPTLIYSTYLGGSYYDYGYSIAVDGSGNAYITGWTTSTDFPTQNPLQPNHGGGDHAFVTKLNPSGSTLIYSTYLGGSEYDYGNGIAVDSSGNAYITGRTYSIDFPTQNPLQPNYGGAYDAFVTKLNPSGSTLIYSTYLGGGEEDRGYDIAVDGSGNAYVTGDTSSTNFPTQNPLQPNYGGGRDAFVTKLNPSGSTLIYSTYLGGSEYDRGNGIAVDGSGNAYITGRTYSTNFPTQNPLQSDRGGAYDAFVTKLNPSGSTLIYSTCLGGSGYDWGTGIAVDGSGNAYVTGDTSSTNFPTQNPLQPNHNGGYDAFVTKLNPSGSTLIYSTCLGGSGYDWGTGIAVDGSGNAYVTGDTRSTDFPTQNPLQPNYGGGRNAFVAKLNSTGSALIYSTYLGGSGYDHAYGIAVDGSGNAYVTGDTRSTDFPTQNPLQPNYGGGDSDAFVAKIGAVEQQLPDLSIAVGDLSILVGQGETNIEQERPISIRASIHNLGKGEATDVSVYFYNGDPALGAELLGTQKLDSLPSQASAIAQISAPFDVILSKLHVVVDPKDSIPESREDNNETFADIIKLEPFSAYDYFYRYENLKGNDPVIVGVFVAKEVEEKLNLIEGVKVEARISGKEDVVGTQTTGPRGLVYFDLSNLSEGRHSIYFRAYSNDKHLISPTVEKSIEIIETNADMNTNMEPVSGFERKFDLYWDGKWDYYVEKGGEVQFDVEISSDTRLNNARILLDPLDYYRSRSDAYGRELGTVGPGGNRKISFDDLIVRNGERYAIVEWEKSQTGDYDYYLLAMYATKVTPLLYLFFEDANGKLHRAVKQIETGPENNGLIFPYSSSGISSDTVSISSGQMRTLATLLLKKGAEEFHDKVMVRAFSFEQIRRMGGSVTLFKKANEGLFLTAELYDTYQDLQQPPSKSRQIEGISHVIGISCSVIILAKLGVGALTGPPGWIMATATVAEVGLSLYADHVKREEMKLQQEYQYDIEHLPLDILEKRREDSLLVVFEEREQGTLFKKNTLGVEFLNTQVGEREVKYQLQTLDSNGQVLDNIVDTEGIVIPPGEQRQFGATQRGWEHGSYIFRYYIDQEDSSQEIVTQLRNAVGIRDITITDPEGKRCAIFNPGDKMNIKLDYFNGRSDEVDVASKVKICGPDGECRVIDDSKFSLEEGSHPTTITNWSLSSDCRPGIYRIEFSLRDPESGNLYDQSAFYFYPFKVDRATLTEKAVEEDYEMLGEKPGAEPLVVVEPTTDLPEELIGSPMTVEVCYTQDAFDSSGISSEELLALYYWDTKQGMWRMCSESSVDINRNCVIATVYQLTKFAIMSK